MSHTIPTESSVFLKFLWSVSMVFRNVLMHSSFLALMMTGPAGVYSAHAKGSLSHLWDSEGNPVDLPHSLHSLKDDPYFKRVMDAVRAGQPIPAPVVIQAPTTKPAVRTGDLLDLDFTSPPSSSASSVRRSSAPSLFDLFDLSESSPSTIPTHSPSSPVGELGFDDFFGPPSVSGPSSLPEDLQNLTALYAQAEQNRIALEERLRQEYLAWEANNNAEDRRMALDRRATAIAEESTVAPRASGSVLMITDGRERTTQVPTTIRFSPAFARWQKQWLQASLLNSSMWNRNYPPTSQQPPVTALTPSQLSVLLAALFPHQFLRSQPLMITDGCEKQDPQPAPNPSKKRHADPMTGSILKKQNTGVPTQNSLAAQILGVSTGFQFYPRTTSMFSFGLGRGFPHTQYPTFAVSTLVAPSDPLSSSSFITPPSSPGK